MKSVGDAQNQKAQEQARNTDPWGEDFFCMVAHELRTPLTLLILQNELMERIVNSNEGANLPEKATLSKLLKTTGHQLAIFSKLVTNLFSLSEIATGKLVLNRTQVDLSAIANEVTSCFQEEFKKRNYSIDLAFADSLIGNWDYLRLEQVIINLITNAMKFGQGKPIRIATQRIGQRAQLTVSDQGMGISVTDQVKIFQRYEQLGSNRPNSGLGLGLFISQQIIFAHGGIIRVESQLNQGTTFIVELPL